MSPINLDIPEDAAERVARQDAWRRLTNRRALLGADFPRAPGISRVADNDKAILISFERPLTDDEMRRLHDALSGASP